MTVKPHGFCLSLTPGSLALTGTRCQTRQPRQRAEAKVYSDAKFDTIQGFAKYRLGEALLPSTTDRECPAGSRCYGMIWMPRIHIP